MSNKIEEKNYLIRSICKTRGTKLGFSLIELIIVISILGMVAAATFVMFNGTRNRVVLEDAQASVINALEQARSRAATGVGTTSHGVYIEGNKIITFEGNTYVPGTGDETTLPFPVSTDQSNLTIIFNRLSATSSADATITLEHTTSGITTTVSVTQDGIIKK